MQYILGFGFVMLCEGETSFLAVADEDFSFEPLASVEDPELMNAGGEKCGIEVNIIWFYGVSLRWEVYELGVLQVGQIWDNCFAPLVLVLRNLFWLQPACAYQVLYN